MNPRTATSPFPAGRDEPVPAGAQRPHAGAVETPGSVLVFFGDRVYKVRKPVELAGLDLRDRPARLAACEAEVVLNRRLAPDIYLGVADVIGPGGELCDHMVVMRRLPAARRLSTLAENGAAAVAEIHSIAEVLAGFHARCATSPRITAAGAPDRLRARWDEHLAEVRRDGGTAVGAPLLDQVDRLAGRYLDGRGELLRERREAGRIRDGHGDLSAADTFCLDDGPRLLDCLESEAELRAADVLADVAALAVDLEWLGRRDLARILLGRYREIAGENHPRSLQDFYCGRRGDAALSDGVSASRGRGGAAGREVRVLAELALARLRQGRVRLVLVGGQRGTGKSTLAGGLAGAEGWTVLRFDVVAAARPAPPDRPDPAAGRGMPADAADAVHTELLRLAAAALCRGESVIVDAPWNRHSQRVEAAEVARQNVADLVQLRCTPRPELGAGRPASQPAAAAPGGGPTRLADSVSRVAPWPESSSIDTAATVAAALHDARRAAA